MDKEILEETNAPEPYTPPENNTLVSTSYTPPEDNTPVLPPYKPLSGDSTTTPSETVHFPPYAYLLNPPENIITPPIYTRTTSPQKPLYTPPQKPSFLSSTSPNKTSGSGGYSLSDIAQAEKIIKMLCPNEFITVRSSESYNYTFNSMGSIGVIFILYCMAIMMDKTVIVFVHIGSLVSIVIINNMYCANFRHIAQPASGYVLPPKS